jgi:hypothetical protein
MCPGAPTPQEHPSHFCGAPHSSSAFLFRAPTPQQHTFEGARHYGLVRMVHNSTITLTEDPLQTVPQNKMTKVQEETKKKRDFL